MNCEKLKSPTRATLTNPNFQSFRELRKSLKYSLRPTFKNPNFESNHELKNAVSQMKIENKGNLHKIRLATFHS